MKKTLLFILSSLSILACRTAKVEPIVSIPQSDMLLGVLVTDTHTGEVLFEHNGYTKFVPASNTKILTLYSGLKFLGDSLQAFRYFWDKDTLYLKGTGDPTLFHPEFPESAAISILKKAKAIVISDENNQQRRYGSGWAWNDFNNYYQVELSSVPVFGNAITFGVENNQRVLSPGYFEKFMKDTTINSTNVMRKEFENVFRHNSSLELSDNYKQTVPFIVGTDLVARLLEDTLKVPVSVKKMPENAEYSIAYSQPVDTVLRRMMQVSDNFLAEQLLILAGEKESGMVSTVNSIRTISPLIFPAEVGSYRWVDGSGLSRYNLFSPSQMVYVLNSMYRKYPQDRLFSLLSIGGKHGTLRNKYKSEDPSAPPYVFAKTGSLGGVYNESGFLVTKSGRLLTYSVMRNNFTGTVSENGIATMNLVKQIRERF